MGFLTPWMLAGLAAVALPVYFHLLQQHRSELRPFSSLMLMEPGTQSSIRHRRLRYWLLLALRLAFIALLVLAFARPYVESWVAMGQAGPELQLWVIDRTFSMRAARRLEEAKSAAIDLLRRQPSEVPIQLAEFGSSLRMLTVSSRNELEAALRSIRPSSESGTLAELAAGLRAVARQHRGSVEVHLFSDFQRSAMPAHYTDLQLPANMRVVAHQVGSAVTNFAVTGVEAPTSVFRPGKVRVRVHVTSFGQEGTKAILSLYCNGRIAGQQNVQIPPHGRVSVEFTDFEPRHGFNACEARLEARDSLPEDNLFRFAVERADPLPLLFVDRLANGRAWVYFRAALEASAENAFSLEARSIAEVGEVDPGRYRLIVLSDPGSLPGKFLARLERWVRNGGAVWMVVGPRMAQLGRLPVVDLAVAGTRYFPPENERFQVVGFADAHHPSVRHANQWQGVRFFQVIELSTEGCQVLVRLVDGTPVLLEKELGSGRVLAIASSLDNVANDFPLHAAFVPFVQQTAAYLAGLERRTAVATVGSFLDIQASRQRAAITSVRGPEGKLLFAPADAAATPSVQLQQEGFYEIHRGQGQVEMIAANADRRESDLEPAPAELLREWAGSGNPQGAVSASSGPERRRRELWWPVLLMALGVGLAETLVSRQYLAIERGTS